ncbi:MAG: TSUP family transporter [Dehalococcoidia bacterium]|nr:TSUP family transporter [Dehalococcoidia bacterium]
MDPFLLKMLLLVLILVAAHTLETILGFGATIIAMSLAIYLFPLTTLLPVLVILGLLQSIWLVGRWFRHIQWRILCLKILPAAAVGMAAGIYYRTEVASMLQLLILLGAFIMVVAVMEIILILRTRAAGGSLPWYVGWPVLIGGGIFHGIFATGGPLIVYYSSREMKEPAEFRATLSTLWLLLNIVLLVNLCTAGQVNLDILKITGLALPGFIAGVILGSIIRLKALYFKILIYALLFLAGLMVLIQQLFSQQ